MDRIFIRRIATMLFIILFLPVIISTNITLTCEDILQYSEETSFTTDELKSMSSDEIDKCLIQLGRSKLPLDQAKIIWNSLINFYGDASSIPDDKLMSLHWITIAIEPEEYSNLTISNIDVVENFGFYYDLSDEQLDSIAVRVREDWGDKFPEDYTSYDLSALKQILCAFNASEISRIHPSAYKDAAASLSNLQRCPKEVLESLAQLAVDEQAFGPTDQWNQNIITTIGTVVNGIPQHLIDKIPKDKKLSNKLKG